MKIYIVGDACSGKSTFLNKFSDGRFQIFPEEGHLNIPPLLEEDKFFSYLWFYLYPAPSQNTPQLAPYNNKLSTGLADAGLPAQAGMNPAPFV